MARVVSRAFRFINQNKFETLFISRSYGRNAIIRKPVRVLNTQPEESAVPPVRDAEFADFKELYKHRGVTREPEVPAIIETPEQNVVSYQKLHKNDARFTKILGIVKNRKQREKHGKMLLEGKRLINDAIEAGMKMEALYFSREKDLMDIKLKNPDDIMICKVLYKTLKVWSDVTTCPGVTAVFRRPTADDLNIFAEPSIPVSILCDNIRDPGNLGSIIRNAAAAGCENVFLMKGCVDPWETKVLRAGCGGHFRIPIVNDIEWSQVSNYFPSNSTIFVADNSADIDEISATADFINFVEPEIKEEEEDTKYITFNEHNQPVRIDESFDSKSKLEKYEDIQVPCHLYSAVKYPKNNIVLYIGGETHGIDSRINKLVYEYGGEKIKIPMENGINSLNAAFAMTVILYEIKRQCSRLYISDK